MVFQALGILEYPTVTFFMGTDWRMVVFDMGLEE